jgi:hypothetical protein
MAYACTIEVDAGFDKDLISLSIFKFSIFIAPWTWSTVRHLPGSSAPSLLAAPWAALLKCCSQYLHCSFWFECNEALCSDGQVISLVCLFPWKKE